jgi:hypothetical protein
MASSIETANAHSRFLTLAEPIVGLILREAAANLIVLLETANIIGVRMLGVCIRFSPFIGWSLGFQVGSWSQRRDCHKQGRFVDSGPMSTKRLF